MARLVQYLLKTTCASWSDGDKYRLLDYRLKNIDLNDKDHIEQVKKLVTSLRGSELMESNNGGDRTSGASVEQLLRHRLLYGEKLNDGAREILDHYIKGSKKPEETAAFICRYFAISSNSDDNRQDQTHTEDRIDKLKYLLGFGVKVNRVYDFKSLFPSQSSEINDNYNIVDKQSKGTILTSGCSYYDRKGASFCNFLQALSEQEFKHDLSEVDKAKTVLENRLKQL